MHLPEELKTRILSITKSPLTSIKAHENLGMQITSWQSSELRYQIKNLEIGYYLDMVK